MSYTLNNAGEIIQGLNKKYGESLCIGAGTVLDSETARHTNGPKLVKVFKTPIPDMPVLASGGINLDNLHVWLENGVDICGLGSLLTKGTVGKIAKNTKKIREIIKNIREV